MKSMTGYGYAEFLCAEYILTMELKAYNNRYLEVNFFAPQVLSVYEQEFTEKLKNAAQRGHVDVSVKLKMLSSGVDFEVDEGAARAYLAAVKKVRDICAEEGLEAEFRLSDVLSCEGVITGVRAEGIDRFREGLDFCTNEVLGQFAASKEREGLAAKKDLGEMIDSIDSSVEKISLRADGLEELIRTNLETRIKEMLSDRDYDENRVLSEVAVLLMKYTINEELVRLGAHIAEFRRLLESDGPVGKRMDFLCQEMNREINTIGSKSQIVEVNFEVVNMKDCLENIREQIRNIE